MSELRIMKKGVGDQTITWRAGNPEPHERSRANVGE